MQYQFDIMIAQKYGVDEAVFVHNIYFWCMKNAANEKHFHDGKYWTYSTMEGLTKIFPFWTKRQIERIVNACREKGLIETSCFSTNPRDRTLWYAVTETVKCIYGNGEMENTKQGNGYHQTVKCINETDSKPDSKPDTDARDKTQNTEMLFEKFWNAYPKHVGKQDAYKSFSKLKPDTELVQKMLSAIAWQRNLESWNREDSRFIPNPATWLNQHRWEDEPPCTTSVSAANKSDFVFKRPGDDWV